MFDNLIYWIITHLWLIASIIMIAGTALIMGWMVWGHVENGAEEEK